MNFKELYNQVTSSDQFKKFTDLNPEAELVAGFFILDFLSHDIKNSLDYKVGEKIFTFSVDDKDKLSLTEDNLVNAPNRPQLSKIKPEVGIEVDELKSIAGTKALDEGVHAKFHKIIAVLQNYEEKQIWNLTCMLDELLVLNILVDSNSGEILKFEKKSIMSFIRKTK
jgi:hypothetical protein